MILYIFKININLSFVSRKGIFITDSKSPLKSCFNYFCILMISHPFSIQVYDCDFGCSLCNIDFWLGGHKLTVTFSCIHCNADFWSTIYALTSQRFMWPDAFNLSSPVLGLGRIIIINIWYLLLFFDICGLVKQGYWLQRSPQTDV